MAAARLVWLWPPMIRLTGLPAVFSFWRQGLVAVDRDAVAVAAIGVTEVAQDDDHIRRRPSSRRSSAGSNRPDP